MGWCDDSSWDWDHRNTIQEELRLRSNYYWLSMERWGVAQLAERLAVNQEVGGSSPPAPVFDFRYDFA